MAMTHYGYEAREGEPYHLGTESAFDEDAPCELPEDGVELSGEQCDGCGCSGYTLRLRAVGPNVIVCTGDEVDGERREGCGAEYPVRPFEADDLIW